MEFTIRVKNEKKLKENKVIYTTEIQTIHKDYIKMNYSYRIR